ncbi:AAA family ATPase [Cohnella sp. CFH 77786]|uniref:AAA family ATPase n=1 Tax=Cohnella sp. CFH 77786 TaxID=2662265 RepID=UPI001C60B1FF|nr:AAA family ATPase [Cohnella sp. CFH 77786]MBW5446594.1 AAA family ATPase [Cohnella sp. CFH 77786]
MRNWRTYGKEIAIGFVFVLLLFLIYIGVPAMPIVTFAMVAAALFFLTKARGGMAVGSVGRKGPAKAPQFLSFEDIGGQEQAKKELVEALEFMVKREEIRKLGIRPLKGILLTGPPGTGKTLLAKAAAHYTQSAFVAASGSEFVEMYVGVGASRIRDLFKEARSQAAKLKRHSAVVFIDEIDGIGGKRDGGGQHREYDQTLNQLLTEMDGIQGDESIRILLIAATNRKELLDPALLRPGRFDRHIQVDLPDKKGREHILRLHARNKPLEEDVSLVRVAEETFGFSGAQLESVMNEAAIYALREDRDRLSQSDLTQAVDKVMMGERTDRETTREERERVAMHELGHAIMAETLRPGSVAQVSLTPRGQALGYVRHHPRADSYLYTKQTLEDQIMIALGGAAAEELIYGGRSTGSRGDFEQATDIVRTLIESGMSELGIIHPQALTKEEWARENASILDGLMERTREYLSASRDKFDQLLSILVQEETLSGDRLRECLGKTSPDSAAS